MVNPEDKSREIILGRRLAAADQPLGYETAVVAADKGTSLVSDNFIGLHSRIVSNASTSDHHPCGM